ncbi:MAG: molybdopterin guanine dinucleotide synthesis [Cypionkella sp.]|uniref:molybdopterin guanine dinucleotide synthesis n=1 Tax=Cypionkella sp. TaxID=2811411 RepID=UPI002ABA4D6C|nr:molybdopterin guanine dinucleotide synthesis [Cypionkella sp.]MDZ4312001.1 molybdopterin guanine dinucleotide synthesis [Cypionkella sp.]
MQRFDRVIVADWSAAATLSPARPSADAIWLGSIDASGASSTYHRSRSSAEATLAQAIDTALARGESLLIGCDFPMGYPKGFASHLTGTPTAPAVWAWLAAHIQDAPDNHNNRFQIAAHINRHFATATSHGPFWGRPTSLNLSDLPTTKAVDYSALNLSERRGVETVVPRAQPVWKLYTTGAAGSQGLIGQPMIHRLSQRPQVAVWPFDPPAQITLAEVYPSLVSAAVRRDPAPIKDEAQVRLLAQALFSLSHTGQLADLLDCPANLEEGWILGAGHTTALLGALP